MFFMNNFILKNNAKWENLCISLDMEVCNTKTRLRAKKLNVSYIISESRYLSIIHNNKRRPYLRYIYNGEWIDLLFEYVTKHVNNLPKMLISKKNNIPISILNNLQKNNINISNDRELSLALLKKYPDIIRTSSLDIKQHIPTNILIDINNGNYNALT